MNGMITETLPIGVLIEREVIDGEGEDESRMKIEQEEGRREKKKRGRREEEEKKKRRREEKK